MVELRSMGTLAGPSREDGQTPVLHGLARRAVRSTWWSWVFFSVFILATRVPYEGHQLFNYDSVNFAYSIGHFDIAQSQPQAPGYPLFVLELRAFRLIGFKRPESILFAVRILGSIGSALALVYLGDRILGHHCGVGAGVWAAVLLSVHPVFWFSSLTSGVRLQLTIVSVVVAGLCYECWQGNKRHIFLATVALGIGAGIRPELGAMLLPLWVASVFRAESGWYARARATAVLVASVLSWLLPTALVTGGFTRFVELNWVYLNAVSTTTSVVFGADVSSWFASLCWLFVWVFCAVPGLAIPAVISAAKGGPGLLRNQWIFLSLWFWPGFLFSALIHVADPGHTLAIIPIVCLVGGYWIQRAAFHVASLSSGVRFVAAHTTGAAALYFTGDHSREYVLPVLCIIWTIAAVSSVWPNVQIPRMVLRANAGLLVFTPAAFLCAFIFYRPVWFYSAASGHGLGVLMSVVWQHVNSGLRATSLAQMRSVIDTDDHTIREARHLIADHEGATVIVWEQGLTEWRKATYYFPNIPVFALESSGFARVWRGPEAAKRFEPGEPVILPPKSRVIWLLDPRSPFYRRAAGALPLIPSGPILYTDLEGDRSVRVGNFDFRW